MPRWEHWVTVTATATYNKIIEWKYEAIMQTGFKLLGAACACGVIPFPYHDLTLGPWTMKRAVKLLLRHGPGHHEWPYVDRYPSA